MSDKKIKVSWRIENWEPGGERHVRAWVRVDSPSRDMSENSEFGAEEDAEDRAVAWVRNTVPRLRALMETREGDA